MDELYDKLIGYREDDPYYLNNTLDDKDITHYLWRGKLFPRAFKLELLMIYEHFLREGEITAASKKVFKYMLMHVVSIEYENQRDLIMDYLVGINTVGFYKVDEEFIKKCIIISGINNVMVHADDYIEEVDVLRYTFDKLRNRLPENDYPPSTVIVAGEVLPLHIVDKYKGKIIYLDQLI